MLSIYHEFIQNAAAPTKGIVSAIAGQVTLNGVKATLKRGQESAYDVEGPVTVAAVKRRGAVSAAKSFSVVFVTASGERVTAQFNKQRVENAINGVTNTRGGNGRATVEDTFQW